MMDFNYFLPTKVLFGPVASEKVGNELTLNRCRRVLVVCGRKSMRETGILDKILGCLGEFEVVLFESVESDPSTETINEGVKHAKGCDAVVGLGGGSALDAAKAISVVATNGGDAVKYLEGKKADKIGIPVFAIPTTAGTASEVTQVSVLSDHGKKIKKSFRSQYMYPKTALVDYTLTLSMPKNVTASSGLDALTHAIESMTSTKTQPIPNTICVEAAGLAVKNLGNAYKDGKDNVAMENMMLSSLMAGFGITHSGAGLCHGLSYAIWRLTEKPHGLICGMLLPHVMRYNRGYDRGVYGLLARHCRFKNENELIDKISELNNDMDVPEKLSEWSIGSDDIGEIVKYGMGGSTMTNPRETDPKELAGFIEDII
ncbi:MAG: iron-containing alcohol dehydrogenase [Candidatus Altiarchaeota archaeon]|nr:iron-containing alcohol dehydrogenase [Candidatus Altiarchaeota archaeon]